MILSKEIYKRFLLSFNKNDSNAGANIPISHFVLTFNSERLRWLNDFFDKDDWRLQQIDNLLVVDKNVVKVGDLKDAVSFKLPDDFFRHAFSYSIADRGSCVGQKIYNFEKKSLGFNSLLLDDFNKPQFDYRETPFIISQNKMNIYFDDFKIKKVFLSYYKTPDAIDIAGYFKIDGTQSEDIVTDLTLKQVDDIIERVVKKMSGQVLDTERFQIATERLNTEK